MKLNKSKNNKGKIHPSPSSSSSSTIIDPISNLTTLLPATILTLISVLSLQDKEVLAYMISHSLSSPFDSSSSSSATVKTTKKVTATAAAATTSKGKKVTAAHTVPTFDCGCFECYTSYWFRWDSSPHRELIHQAIEAFEEHLAAVEQPSKKVTPKSTRRREKVKKFDACSSESTPAAVVVDTVEEASPEEVEECAADNNGGDGGGDDGGEEAVVAVEQKGLGRKVLPDVIGLFNSRLWNLWGPNV